VRVVWTEYAYAQLEEASREDIRELIISPYRLIYRRDTDAVTITMVLHERRLLSPKDLG